MRNFKDEQGYLTFALGEQYLRCAYAQALSIKLTQKNNKYAVVVDTATNAIITDEQRAVFDHIAVIDYTPTEWDMTQDWRALELTPWRETIMLNADIIFPASIDHWWDAMRLRDVCFTTHIVDYKDMEIKSRWHRKLFDKNNLPNVYSAFFYFRYSATASKLFGYAKEITENWEWFSKEYLVGNIDMRVRNDELFAIAAQIVGIEQVTLPHCIPKFVHCKAPLWEGLNTLPWYEQVYIEWDGTNIKIGHHPQSNPVHYYHKEWLTDDIIRQYGRNYKEFLDCRGRSRGSSQSKSSSTT